MIILYSIVLPATPHGRIAKNGSIGNLTWQAFAGGYESDWASEGFPHYCKGSVPPNCIHPDALITEACFSPRTIHPVS